jgi:hemoglobin-like flavoprotein
MAASSSCHWRRSPTNFSWINVMTPRQQDLVQSTFAKVVPIADQAAVIFYDDLFARDPSLRNMFPDEMSEQRRKLMAMLGTAVTNLKQWDKVAAAVQALGNRHIAYGVQPSHYDLVGASLIATLEKGLGDDFTPEVREAWIACYQVVSAEMLSGSPQ